MARPTLFGDPFRPENAACGAVLVFIVAGLYFRSIKAGLVFAAFPLFFAFPGFLEGRR
jgi:hypothetical protein